MSDTGANYHIEMAQRLSASRAISEMVRNGHLQIYWHFHVPGSGFLLNNAFLGKGIVATIAHTVRTEGEGFVTRTDMSPALGPLETELERVRSIDFPEKTSRRGASFLLEDEATAVRYAAHWHPGAPVHILRCAVLSGSTHRGHLGWFSNPPQESWPQIIRSYWRGEAGTPPHDWEIITDGVLFFPDWEEAPFGIGMGFR